VHCQQLFQNAAQFAGVEGVGAVRPRFLGIVVNFHENAVHPGSYGRAREYRNKFRLTAAGGVFVPV
jgi:hypothetical protein